MPGVGRGAAWGGCGHRAPPQLPCTHRLTREAFIKKHRIFFGIFIILFIILSIHYDFMKNYHTIYIRRCRKVQKINSLRIRVHRYCELTYDTDDSCSTLYWKTHGTKQLLTKRFHRFIINIFIFLNQENPPPLPGPPPALAPPPPPVMLSFDWLALNDRGRRVRQDGRRRGEGVECPGEGSGWSAGRDGMLLSVCLPPSATVRDPDCLPR